MTNKTRLRRTLAAAMLFCLAIGTDVGCSPAGVKLPSVKGKVMFDGKPLPEGTITFIATDTTAMSTVGSVKNGEYSVPAAPGPKKVEITSAVLGVAPPTEPIPAKYNVATQLTANVQEQGPPIDFDLTSN